MAQDAQETSQPPQGSVLFPALRRRPTRGDVWGLVAGRIRSSPGTHIWLLILAVTSVVAEGMSPGLRLGVLHSISTNLVELHRHPVRVLVASAFWTEPPSGFFFYALLFELVHATAERWLGTARWLLVAATAHIGATLVSQKAVFFDIRDDRLPRSLAHTIDIGVSYGLAGVVGVLAYRVPRPWRWGYLAVVLPFFGYQVFDDGSFTDLGHFSAVLIGLCCYAVTPPTAAVRRDGAAPARCRPRRWRR